MSMQDHSDQSPAGTPEKVQRSALSRRSVLHGAAGLAGAGLAATAMAGPLAGAAEAAPSPQAPGGSAGHPGHLAEPVIVHVRDLRSGEMDVFAGEAKTRLRDPGLAARLARAAR